MAAVYDAGRSLTSEAVATWRSALVPFLGSGPSPVLDVGAGTGRFSALLAEWTGSPVLALEPAAAMRARAAAKNRDDSLRLVGGRAEALPLRGASVRVAFLSNVVHHFEDLNMAAAELRRVVVPLGAVLLRGLFSGRDAAARPRFDFSVLMRRYFPAAAAKAAAFPSRAAVVDAFTGAGFSQVASEQVVQVVASDLADLFERLRTRADSTLAAIDDDAFDAGLGMLEADAAREPAAGPVEDRMDLLVFGDV